MLAANCLVVTFLSDFMTLLDLFKSFSTDEQCRELLERLRWPRGPECLRCKGSVTQLGEKLLWCAKCRYQFSVTAGTIFNDSHLPLETWFLAVLLIVEARKGMSANQLKRTIGVSYKTAWYLTHRIRAAVGAAERPLLSGTVELDETYVGGVDKGQRGRGGDKDIKRGIVGTWHKVSAKHLHAYLAETEFRFNRRKRSNLFLDTLRHMVTADPLSFADLVK